MNLIFSSQRNVSRARRKREINFFWSQMSGSEYQMSWKCNICLIFVRERYLVIFNGYF